jgi:hypothetical protein
MWVTCWVWDMGTWLTIPRQRYESSVVCAEWIHHYQNQLERLWVRQQKRRTMATRFDKKVWVILQRPLPGCHTQPSEAMAATGRRGLIKGPAAQIAG